MKTIVIEKYACLRCGHRWFPRSNEKPRVCPRCNSPYWDRKRKEKIQLNKQEDKKHGIVKGRSTGI